MLRKSDETRTQQCKHFQLDFSEGSIEFLGQARMQLCRLAAAYHICSWLFDAVVLDDCNTVFVVGL